jgi:hypothetical protein
VNLPEVLPDNTSLILLSKAVSLILISRPASSICASMSISVKVMVLLFKTDLLPFLTAEEVENIVNHFGVNRLVAKLVERYEILDIQPIELSSITKIRFNNFEFFRRFRVRI